MPALPRYILFFAAAALLHAQATPDLLRQLRQGEVPQRVAAAKALIHPHPAPETVSALLAALKDPDPTVRLAVVTTIEFINRPSSDIVQPIALLLEDPDLSVVRSTLRLLAYWRIRSAVAVPILRRLLSHEVPEIRNQAIEVLTPLANVTRMASEALVDGLRDPAFANRAAAASGLAISGRVPAAAVPTLTALLADEDDKVVSASAAALSVAGEQAAPALPQLIAALRHDNEDVRRQSAHAIGRIAAAGPAAVAALTQALEDQSPAVVQAAQQALREIQIAPPLRH